jgi:hypothetical protein
MNHRVRLALQLYTLTNRFCTLKKFSHLRGMIMHTEQKISLVERTNGNSGLDETKNVATKISFL